MLVSMARPGKYFRARSTAVRTTSATSTQSRLAFNVPASMRVMSSRLATKRVSLPLSSSIDCNRSSRLSAGIWSPSWRRLVTAPVIVASGVFRSCEIDESSAERNFSPSSRAACSQGFARQPGAVDGDRRLVEDRCESPLLVRSQRLVLLHGSRRRRRRRAGVIERPELERAVRQRAGAVARPPRSFSNAQRAAVMSVTSELACRAARRRASASSPSSGNSSTACASASVCIWVTAAQSTSSASTVPESLREKS